MKITVHLTKKEYKEMLNDIPDIKGKWSGIAVFNKAIDPTHYTRESFAKKFGPKKALKKVAKKKK